MTQDTPLAIVPQMSLTPAEFKTAIDEARQKATALAEIVEAQGLFSLINKKKYLHVEAWEIIGRGYNVGATIEWSRPLPDGGWEARALVVTDDGIPIGAAESECGTEGDSPWNKRASYAQRSMAQTRAVSKALRIRLSWVVILAGYAATPFEEMPEDDRNEVRQDPIQPSGQWTMSDAQKRRLWAIMKSVGKSNDEMHFDIKTMYVIDSANDLTRDQYDELTASYDRLPKVAK